MQNEILSKICSQCKKNKPLSEFHKDNALRDGHQHQCKSCKRIYMQQPKIRAQQYVYSRTVKGKIVAHRCYKKSYLRNPHKWAARTAIVNAVAYGKLPSAKTLLCSCGEWAAEYHHLSYEPCRQLDVIPMCFRCHRKIHRKALP